MSDYLAVGGVSAVLKSLLTTALAAGGPSTILGAAAGITNVAPDLVSTGPDESAQINLFLYYASINPALRNLGLPSMSANGASLSNPPLAINLHYLVTAYGSNPFDAEILLGWAMQVFHSTPVVPRETIEQALASQAEHIRITPETLTTEEIYRLWTAFQTSYRPTTSYQVSVVVIQDTQSYASNLPVQRRSVLALPLISPLIASVTPAMIASGQTHSVRELCEVAFATVGLDYRDHVVVDPAFIRPAEVDLLVGDATKAHTLLGWKCDTDFYALVEMMVAADTKAPCTMPSSSRADSRCSAGSTSISAREPSAWSPAPTARARPACCASSAVSSRFRAARGPSRASTWAAGTCANCVAGSVGSATKDRSTTTSACERT